jgi:transcriptional repressor NrdR
VKIGEAVMAGLKALDHVAYIRFASIYKDFSDPGDFAEIAGQVREEEPLTPSSKPGSSPPDRLL